MEYSVIPARELTDSHQARWLEILNGSALLENPYFHPEFTLSCAEARDDVFVGIIESDNTVVGFYPFQKKTGKTAVPVGGALSDYQGLIIDDSLSIDPKQLLRGFGLKAWRFDHLLCSQAAFQTYHQEVANSFVIDLSEGVANYLEVMGKGKSSFIKAIARKRRKMEREQGEIRFEYHTDDSDVLDQLILWKSEQFKRTGLMNIFDFEWTQKLARVICKQQTSGFSGMLSALYVNDQLVAAHFGMRSKTVLHWWFPSYNQDFGQYSPGSILLLDIIQHLADGEVNLIDLGKGEARYKDQFSNAVIEVAEGEVSLSSYPAKFKRLGEYLANLIRKTPLVVLARLPARLIRHYQRWKELS